MRTPTRSTLTALATVALTVSALPALAHTAADVAEQHDRILALRAHAAVAAHTAVAGTSAPPHAVRVVASDAPSASDRPATDRPVTDRSVTDRPADRPAPHREETFPVGEIGAVTLAWNQHGIRIVGVRTADGWRSEVVKEERRAVAVGFSNGESGALFWARLTRDGLKHGVERRPANDQRDVRTYEVLDAGSVAIAVTDHGLRLVGVREAAGWASRHEVAPRRIHVVFLNREERRRIDFVAELTREGEVVTSIRESSPTDEAPTTPSREGDVHDERGSTDRKGDH